MSVLIDTSIWIDYFKSGDNSAKVDDLLDENTLVINDVILAELIPVLVLRKQFQVVDLLKSIPLLSLNIDWSEIIDWQTQCLASGVNGIGLADLIIAQNAKQHGCRIYALDKHFKLLNAVITQIQLFH